MKRILFLFVFALPLSTLAQDKIAFVNESALLDSCLKNKYNYLEEIEMMKDILKKAEDKRKNETDPEKIKILDNDIVEYKSRIELRKKEVDTEENRIAHELKAKEDIANMTKKLVKKLKYNSVQDVSKERPVYYDSKNDITLQVWEALKK